MTAPALAPVLSGMRPTGALHLGHYHGALKNWVQLQANYPCYFFVADWHALTTHYETRDVVAKNGLEMVIDWLAAGVDPERSTLFVQSRIPEHAELFTLLSMGTPLSWLERMPTYKDQMEKLKDRDLATYGFLGYPLLQAADILIYKAGFVPVGEDQVPHVEITREVARRFNFLYGREDDFEERAQATLKKLAKADAKQLLQLRKQFQEAGSQEALSLARDVVARSGSLSASDGERLDGWLRGTGSTILPEPQALLTQTSKLPGLDGDKMSKSYGNTIAMRDHPATVEQKIKRMPTDPQRVRRTDAGDPARCPVFKFHQVYTDDATRAWVTQGCTSAGIGCLECKQPVIEAVLTEQAAWRELAEPWVAHPERVREVLSAGTTRARAVAQSTMQEVRAAMGLTF